MSPELILFFFRLISAVLLIAFLGLITWFLYQDIQAVRQATDHQLARPGLLRISSSSLDGLPVGSIYELAPVTTIGRNPRNSIVLEDNYVSNDHAILIWRDAKWWLEDLGSRNGTLLNGISVTDSTVLSAGDLITIGGVEFKLEIQTPVVDKRGESGIRDSNP